MLSEVVEVTDNPFPGLRPFQYEESRLFFGRDGLSQELLERLTQSRFLAVVGSSGSGKSSLVRAGLLPILYGGFMDEAGPDWRVAVMRPGNNPISELGRVLNDPGVLGLTIDENELSQQIIIDETLARGSKGLVEIVRQAELAENEENLLLVVDQFEELFRYASNSTDAQLLERGVISDGSKPVAQSTASSNGNGLLSREGEKYWNEAAGFVRLLLEATQQTKVPIFVVITMRSDYFGNCAQFQGLPEAINEGQYLIPRLTRDQQRQAITKPVEISGGEITPRLVSQLLNDIGEDSDQLPLLQHALMRTWKKGGKNANGKKLLDLEHYLAIGGMASALSNHAEAAFNYLSDERKKIAEKLFKCLTVKGPEGQEVRRPTVLKDICEIIEEDEKEVIEVIEVFRRRGRSFLMPPVNEPLNAESQIDISHESLIRCWLKLRCWVDEEAQSASRYRRLADTAVLHKAQRAELLRGSDAHYALEWYQKAKPNEAWAKRYHTADFGTVMDFLEKSKELRNRELEAEELERRTVIRRRFIRILKRTLSVASLLLLAVSIFATIGWRSADEESTVAEHQGYAAHMAVAQTFYDQGDFAAANAQLNWISDHIKSDLTQPLNNFAGFEWYYLLKLSRNDAGTLPQPTPVPVSAVAYVPGNNQRIVAGSEDGVVRIWDKVDKGWVQQAELNISPNVPIKSLALSPSDGLLATVSVDGKVRLCNLGIREVKDLAPSDTNSTITTVAFSPDGKRLAAGGLTHSNKEGGTLSLWQINSDSAVESRSIPIKKIKTSGEPFSINAIAFSPKDGTVMAIGTTEGVKLLDRVSSEKLDNETIKERPTSDPTADKKFSVFSVAFSPINENVLAIGGSDSKVRFWDFSSNELSELQVHTKEISSVTFSRSGERLATGSYDGSVKLWDTTAAGLELIKKEATVRPTHLPLKPSLRGHAGHVKSVAFSPDGSTLVTGSNDGTAKLWDVGRPFQDINDPEFPGLRLNIHNSAILSLAYFPDGTSVVSGSADKSFRFTSLKDVFQTRKKDRHPDKLADAVKAHSTAEPSAGDVSVVTVSGKGKMLAIGNWSGGLRLWDLSDGGPSRKVELPALLRPEQQGKVLSISFSPNETVLAASLVNNGQESVSIWQLESRQLIDHSIKASVVAFSPTDSRLLASGGADNTVRLWRFEGGKPEEIVSRKAHRKSILCIAFSPDGKLLATGSADNTIMIWKVDTLERLAILKGHSDAISSVAFSSTSDRLATGSYDGSVKLWDTSYHGLEGASQPLALSTLKPSGAPLSLKFSPDNLTLAAGDANGNLCLWRADHGGPGSPGPGTAQ